MRVLALDTTTRGGSAALIDGALVDERRGDDSRSHAERLPSELTRLLEARGLAPASIDLFGVASGPGSFTGLRIGIATMQGLAFVTKRPVVGVSALDALGHAIAHRGDTGALVSVWMDAQRGEVFDALYRIAAAAPFALARLETIGEPSVGDPRAAAARVVDAVSGAARPVNVLFTGDGASRYRHLLPAADFIETPLIAAAVGRLALARAALGEATGPGGVRPLYIRRPDAELDRERRAVGTGRTP